MAAVMQPDCAAAVTPPAGSLRDLGHFVEEAHPPALERMASIGPLLVPILTVYRYLQFRWIEQEAGRPLTQDELDHPLVTEAMATGIPAVSLHQGTARDR